jgi:ubiquinone/menaquinone biosynthesis C-methylase UbiE
MIISLWEALKPIFPKSLRPAVRLIYRRYMRLYCWYVGLWDRWQIKGTGFDSLPSATLRYRVHGSPHINGFLEVGRNCVADVDRALQRIDQSLSSFSRILDFGCGCGRTIIWLRNLAPNSELFGTDIDSKAIAWCRRNIEVATFEVNSPEPPLPFPDASFDLILGITVFTQIGEDHHFQWLDELQRVVRTGGLVLITIRGETCWRTLDREEIDQIRRDGFLFRVTGYMKGIFPEWYQAAYHTRGYIESQYAKRFQILSYLEAGLDNSQDIILLQKR